MSSTLLWGLRIPYDIFTFLLKMFPGIVIRYVLKSMAYESTEARQKFPRLLQLVELYPGSDVEAFKRKVISLNNF